MKANISIEGLERVVKAMRLLDGSPGKTAAGEIASISAWGLRDEAYQNTHVITGYLRASHTVFGPDIFGGEYEYYVTPIPWVVNPLGDKPAIYGLTEEQRGGTHSFYGIAVTSADEIIDRAAEKVITRRLP